MTHEHDYKVKLTGDGLKYQLVCRCGDVAPDMRTALLRQIESRETNINTVADAHLVVAMVCAAFGATVAFIWMVAQ